MNDKKNTETIKQLYQSLITLSYTKDIDLIHVKELVQNASISRSTFYTYFSNIDEMIMKLEDQLLDKLPTSSQIQIQDHGNIKKAWIKQWFLYYRDHQEALNMLLGPHGHGQFYQKIKDVLISELDRQMNQDGYPDDSLRKYFQSAYAENFLRLAMEWTQKKYKDDLDVSSLCQIALALRDKEF